MSLQFPDFFWYGTFCAQRNAGGLVIGIRHEIVNYFSAIEVQVPIRGRISMLTLGAGIGALQICNIHLLPGLSIFVFRDWLKRIKNHLLPRC